jgi:hypothetical protein
MTVSLAIFHGAGSGCCRPDDRDAVRPIPLDGFRRLFRAEAARCGARSGKVPGLPGDVRDVAFSPRVVRTPGGAEVKRETIEVACRYGRGRLEFLEYRIETLVTGKKAGISWMRFEVELSRPALPPLDSRTLYRSAKHSGF